MNPLSREYMAELHPHVVSLKVQLSDAGAIGINREEGDAAGVKMVVSAT